MRDNEDVWREVRRRIGPVSPTQREIAERRYYVDEVKEDPDTLDDLISFIQDLRDCAAEPGARATSTGRPKVEVVHPRLEQAEIAQAEALGRYFAEHAARSRPVSRFRRRFIARDDPSAGLFDDGNREAVDSYWSSPYQGELLTEGEASALLRSPAAARLTARHFLQWGIPVTNHTASLLSESVSDIGVFRVQEAILEVDPPGAKYTVRHAACRVIDGFLHSDGRKPDFPPRSNGASLAEALASVVQEELDGDDGLSVCVDFDEFLRNHLSWISEGNEIEIVPIWPRSVLDELRRLAEDLAAEYSWQVGDSAWFVLTGRAPLHVPILGKWQHTVRSDFERGRIIVEAEPWVSSRVFASAHRSMQKRVLGRDNHRPHRRNVELFRFISELGGPSGKSGWWTRARCEWNHQHPECTYSDDGRMMRDYHVRAKRLLLKPRLRGLGDPDLSEDFDPSFLD